MGIDRVFVLKDQAQEAIDGLTRDGYTVFLTARPNKHIELSVYQDSEEIFRGKEKYVATGEACFRTLLERTKHNK